VISVASTTLIQRKALFMCATLRDRADSVQA
jgi:hypothetical protein